MSRCFLAIDFETAHYKRDSACAVGLVRVEGRKKVAQEYFLIRPPYREFFFTHVHGLTWKHVEKAPLFSELWPKIQPLFEGIDFIAAHNAPFDRAVLNACCLRYGIPAPTLPYLCTVQVARKELNIHPANLPAVCQALKIPLDHHHAMSDAVACAHIVLASAALKKSAPPLLISHPTRLSDRKTKGVQGSFST